MTITPLQPVHGESAWTGREMASLREWVHELSSAEIADLDRAVAHARSTGKSLAQLTRDDFPIGMLAQSVDRWLDALDTGRGFVLVRGVPVER